MKKISAPLIAALFIALVAQSAKAENCAPHFVYSAKRFAKEAANFVMKHGGISLLEALSGTSKGAYFCGGEGEPPAGCSFDEALEYYKASPEDATFLEEFVGQLETQKKDGVSYAATGFIVRTETCAGNNLIFTNSHAFFNRKTGEIVAKNSKFCLKGTCYELDLDAISKMEKQGLLGRKQITRNKERALDYIVLPIKGKKRPAPQRVAKLIPFEKSNHWNVGIRSAGYHIDNKKIYSLRQCKIKHIMAENPLTLFHNCPGQGGSSGAPLINSDNEVVAFHASGKGKNGQPYDPHNDSFNMGGAISQKLIDNLNRYCSDSN